MVETECISRSYGENWLEISVCRPDILPGDWRSGGDPGAIEDALRRDGGKSIRAVCVVHGAGDVDRLHLAGRHPLAAALDAAGHPSLLMVDTISSLGSIAYDHDRLGVDVTIG